MWTFSQSGEGLMDPRGDVIDEDAYAGNGDGLNNPAAQDQQKVGPLPTGLYTIGQAFVHPHLGPVTMVLTPDPANDMHGRSAFRIHGDNSAGDQSASEGCVVAKRATREQVNFSHDRVLRVVASFDDLDAKPAA